MTADDPLLCLALLPGLTSRAQRDLQDRGSLADTLARPADHTDLLGAEARRRLLSGEAWLATRRAAERASAQGQQIVGRHDPEYPPLLREIFDPPPVLWVRGCLVTGEEQAIAIVGSRAASGAGLVSARDMACGLAARGVTIVSGLARGIDAAAHEGALRGGGRTVAVLGSGLNRPYPAENQRLLAAIVAAGGAVVSEFPPDVGPRRDHFPRRNRIVVGWSRAVVIIEAAQRSGALITARLANDEGRDVLAVPAHPSHEGAAGSNQLLRDGAALVRGAEDVAEELRLSPPPPTAVTAEADPVLRALQGRAPVSLDELQQRSGIAPVALLSRLGALELSARVRRLPGNLYLGN